MIRKRTFKFLSNFSIPKPLGKTKAIQIVPHYETEGSHYRTSDIDAQKILNYDTAIR